MDFILPPQLQKPNDFKITEIRIIGTKGIIKKFKTIDGYNRYAIRQREKYNKVKFVRLEVFKSV